ncbi:hypothetical protein SAMN05660653_00390 [Desulfonatronum thiosulfatophilum]|uniref:Uncharacterized protein n=1 Tax=Desulfonatronum thiosulfatophilum TaxID=617002 RepID=A0A1G6AIU3_9BACT|nr:hypothetical protein [Desulfonatronum thiosulfatophilum]SDB08331.1 hypothetical protein SAMN05660653_00390 [Desulfonatronum thiosulfatophilum]
MTKPRNDSIPGNVILGAYFAGKRHPQHGQAVTASSFDYFAGWYHSICRLGLHGVLLHDHLSEAFTAKYEQWFATLGGTGRGGSFRFQRVHPGDFTAGDERFFLFRDYLKGNQANRTRHVFIVDVADAWFRADPFRLIENRSFWNYLDLTGLIDAARGSAGWEHDPFMAPEGLPGWWRTQREHLTNRHVYRLFLGAEDTRIENNPWMLKHFDQVYGRRFSELNDKPVLNCGVIGGTREDVALLLEQVCAEMQSLQVRAVLNDMVVFNKILHEQWTGAVYSGGALNAPWKRWRKKGRHAIFHK